MSGGGALEVAMVSSLVSRWVLSLVPCVESYRLEASVIDLIAHRTKLSSSIDLMLSVSAIVIYCGVVVIAGFVCISTIDVFDIFVERSVVVALAIISILWFG